MSSITSKSLQNAIDNKGFNATKRRALWQSKSCDWNWIGISWGLRRSKKRQILPIWNTSNNTTRSLLFGFNFWYFEFSYSKKGKSFQHKKIAKYLPRFNRSWNLYNLIF